jgi:NADH:ubiquinone oxidoreductase subunit
MSFGTLLFTWFHGQRVGADALGNRYYRRRRPFGSRRERRWVLYNGAAEASKVPPEWHAWLHYTTDAMPDPKRQRRAWEKPHQQNLSGSALAYRPPGHTLQGGRRARGTGDYEPWIPS